MISKRKLIIALLIYTIFGQQTQGQRLVKFKSAESRFSPDYFHNFSLKALHDSIYMEMMVIKPLVVGFKANLGFQLRLNNSKSYQTLFAYTLDVCNTVTTLKDSIFKKWFQSVLKYGNFMPNCPVAKGHYHLRGWKIERNMVPIYLPPGDYRIKGYGFMGKYKTKNEDFVLEFDVDAIIT